MDSTWNNYLNQYRNLYKIKVCDDQVRAIICKHGEIKPYSLLKRELFFCGNFHSKRKKTAIKKLKPSYCVVLQDGEEELMLKFPENKLPELVNLINIRKRRMISQEQREKLKKIGFKKKT